MLHSWRRAIVVFSQIPEKATNPQLKLWMTKIAILDSHSKSNKRKHPLKQ